MTRLPSDLALHARLGAATPFGYGAMDCTLWVAAWVRQRTGRDAMAEWRGRYRTRLGGLRLIRREPGGLAGAAGRGLAAVGAVAIEPARARPGDVGIIATTDGPCLALRGQLSWLAKTGDGLWRCPIAIAAWRL